jgi:hypothetical protein
MVSNQLFRHDVQVAEPSGKLYQTPRLTLRPPSRHDIAEVFQRIASDPEVTR